jgi:pilus assembly protein CpaB
MKAARIIVLGIAIAAGGAAAMLAGRSNQKPPPPAPEPTTKMETADILVAGEDIAIGQRLSAQNLHWQVWPAAATSPQWIRQSERPGAIQQLTGSIARMSFVAGEPIRETKLVAANGSGYMAALLPPGMRAVSTEISPETGVAGFVLPNDRVDVILTRAEKTSQDEVYTTEIVLPNVKVLAIDQNVEEKNGQRTVTGKIATFALTPRQAQTLAVARRLGTLSLALRSLVPADKSDPDDADAEKLGRRETVNIVRFGRNTTALK